MSVTFTPSSFAVPTIQSIDKLKSANTFGTQVYARGLVTYLFARTFLEATKEIAWGVTLLPFAAVKLLLDQVSPKLLSERVSFGAIGHHLKQSARCTTTLIRLPECLFNPNAVSTRYKDHGVVPPNFFDPKATFDSLAKHVWANQTAVLTAATFLVAAVALNRSGLLTSTPPTNPTTPNTPTTPITNPTPTNTDTNPPSNEKPLEQPPKVEIPVNAFVDPPWTPEFPPNNAPLNHTNQTLNNTATNASKVANDTLQPLSIEPANRSMVDYLLTTATHPGLVGTFVASAIGLVSIVYCAAQSSCCKSKEPIQPPAMGPMVPPVQKNGQELPIQEIQAQVVKQEFTVAPLSHDVKESKHSSEEIDRFVADSVIKVIGNGNQKVRKKIIAGYKKSQKPDVTKSELSDFANSMIEKTIPLHLRKNITRQHCEKLITRFTQQNAWAVKPLNTPAIV